MLGKVESAFLLYRILTGLTPKSKMTIKVKSILSDSELYLNFSWNNVSN